MSIKVPGSSEWSPASVAMSTFQFASETRPTWFTRRCSDLSSLTSSMVDIIDLCEDEDGPEVSNRRQRDQSCRQSQLSTPKLVLPTLRIQLEPKLDHCNTIARDSPLPASGPGVSQSRAYPESFYVDFITAIEHAFPWQTFALRHRISANDLRHVFFVLITLPLSDPDDNSKRLKVAHGAQKRFSEWRRAWEETVAKTSTSSSECEGTTEWEGSFGNM